MHQGGCVGIVLTKKLQKSPILGIHIKNRSSHTENLVLTLLTQKRVKKPNFGNTHIKKTIE